ncbi:MAG: aldo/keto reductase [Chloroflexi bacterium]|nr:MAG: aldo/keto reductase [Chloroflexota bacterium]
MARRGSRRGSHVGCAAMEQRPFGSTGISVSALGFGCGAVGGLLVRGDADEQRRAVSRALDAGITYFDTAAQYGDGRSEEHLGRVMRELGAWSRVVVGTKVRLGPQDLSSPETAIRASLEASLRRLGRRDVEVFHLHNPIGLTRSDADSLDMATALGSVARGLEAARQAGLARHIGFTGLGDSAALREVVRAEPYETVQAYFNVLNPSAGFTGHSGGQQDFEGLIDTAALAGRGVIVIRVLAAGAAAAEPVRAPNAGDPGRGLVSGGSYAADLERASRLRDLAVELGLEGPVELALRFGLSKPGVSTVLVGYSSLTHLEDAIRYAERGPLSTDAIARVLDVSA